MALVGSLNEPLFPPCLLVGVEWCFYLDLLGFGPFLVCLEPRKNTMKVYVRGKSFKEVNDRLAEGRKLPAMDYSLLRAGIEFTLGEDVPDGTWVCIFKAIQNGFPVRP